MRALTMFVVYENPRDLGPGFAMRVHYALSNGVALPGRLLARNLPTLEAVRAHVPDGLVQLEAWPNDDKVIKEVWV